MGSNSRKNGPLMSFSNYIFYELSTMTRLDVLEKQSIYT